MSEINYIEDYATVALSCLAAGTGTFEERLWDAYNSAIFRLDLKVPPPAFAEDLNWTVATCNRYKVAGESRMSEVSAADRHQLFDRLMSIIITADRIQMEGGGRDAGLLR